MLITYFIAEYFKANSISFWMFTMVPDFFYLIKHYGEKIRNMQLSDVHINTDKYYQVNLNFSTIFGRFWNSLLKSTLYKKY